jgi:hypothetical protein
MRTSALDEKRSRGAPQAELLVSIGGVVGHLVVEEAPDGLLADLRRRYAAFLLPCSPSAARAFSLRVCLRGREPTPLDARSFALPPRVVASKDQVEIDRADFCAELRRARPTGAFQGRAQCRATHVAFESLLRILWSVFLPRAGGALFHACGFQHGERGILAAGQSGAGKTTLSRKVPDPDRVFSDEVIAVHRDAAGQWRISGTPFFGELQRGGVSMQSWPLAGIAFLEQRDAVQVEPLPPAEAVLRALECLLCFQNDPETVRQNFALTIELCRAVPTFRCAGRRETPYADLLAAMAPVLAKPGPLGHPAANMREMISGLRASLGRHGHYAFQPRGGSMRPWLRSGDALFIDAARDRDLVPGDVALYWRVGGSPERDALICHRVIGRRDTEAGSKLYTKGDALPDIETFHDGREAEVIGRVRSILRDGRPMALPGPLASLGIVFGSLLMAPFLRMVTPP